MSKTRLTLAAVALVAASVASAQDITATVNGRQVAFPDVEPMMVNGRVMVPMRGVFEQMGAYVHWDAASRMVHAQGNGN